MLLLLISGLLHHPPFGLLALSLPLLPVPYVKLILFKMPRVESVFLMSFSLLHLLQSALFYLHVEPMFTFMLNHVSPLAGHPLGNWAMVSSALRFP